MRLVIKIINFYYLIYSSSQFQLHFRGTLFVVDSDLNKRKMMDDEAAALVIDNGSGICKVKTVIYST